MTSYPAWINRVLGDDDKLDAMDSAYKAEHDRWCWRRKIPQGKGFELVRNSSPGNNIIGDDYMEITNLTKRECPTSDHAEEWLDAFAGRAAMEAALKALVK